MELGQSEGIDIYGSYFLHIRGRLENRIPVLTNDKRIKLSGYDIRLNPLQDKGLEEYGIDRNGSIWIEI